MKWILIGFFSVMFLLTVLFTAGFELIGSEGPPANGHALPAAVR